MAPPPRQAAARPALLCRAAALLVATLLATASAAAELRGPLSDAAPYAETPAAGFRVKAVDGAPGTGGVRRMIERFSAWTLICDEEKRRRICNASQSIETADGTFAFSWSLAATKGGEPVFIVRAPVTGFPAHTVSFVVGTAETVIRLPSCDTRLCLGFLPMNADIMKGIKERGGVEISYLTTEGAVPVSVVASLDGLGAAIGSIR